MDRDGDQHPEPTPDEIRDALEAAWSMVRLQWETDLDDDSATDALEDQLVEIANQYQPNDIVHALLLVAGRLVVDLEHAYQHMYGDDAHSAIEELLWHERGHASDPPDDEPPEQGG
jgi:hypothetical protein